MAIFLTGVTGYIGSYLAAELLEQHGDVAAAERVRGRGLSAERPIGLEAGRQVEAALEIDGVEVED